MNDNEITEKLIEEKKQKNLFKNIYFYLTIIILLLLVGAGFYFVKRNKTEAVSIPVTSVSPGTYTTSQNVKLNNLANDVVVYYTLDGSDPNEHSILYKPEKGIEISTSTVLKYIAVDDKGNKSTIGSANYQIQPEANQNDFKNSDGNSVVTSSVDSNSDKFNLTAETTVTGFTDTYMQEDFLVNASSSLMNEPNYYSPFNVVDNSLKTGWCEANEGKGINEWISFEYNKDEPFPIDSLTIIGGYAQSPEIFDLNSVPVRLEVLKNDEVLGEINLKQTQEAQKVTFPSTITLNRRDILKLRIKDIAVGINDDTYDTFITEVRFN